MHIIYHCSWGSHASAIAAAIHLKMLPRDHIPSKNDISNMPFFDTIEKVDVGKIIFRGMDEHGHSIYTLACQKVPHLVLPAVEDMWHTLGQRKDQLLVIDMGSKSNLSMKLGGYFSRKLNRVNLGRPILLRGTCTVYPMIAHAVEDIKATLTPLM
ncbi:MAG: DUF3189 family protein [Bacillota bacterium]